MYIRNIRITLLRVPRHPLRQPSRQQRRNRHEPRRPRHEGNYPEAVQRHGDADAVMDAQHRVCLLRIYIERKEEGDVGGNAWLSLLV